MTAEQKDDFKTPLVQAVSVEQFCNKFGISILVQVREILPTITVFVAHLCSDIWSLVTIHDSIK